MNTNLSPACRLIAQFGSRWAILTLLILEGRETIRFNELRRAIPGNISEKMLAATLHELEETGLILRTLYPEVPPRVEYRLREEARTLLPILHDLIDWSKRHTSAIALPPDLDSNSEQ